jgi:hypothetical protein
LTVTAWRLDASAPLYTASSATNAYHPDFGGWAMLVAPDIPTTGCWEISGHYGVETVTFVVWVDSAGGGREIAEGTERASQWRNGEAEINGNDLVVRSLRVPVSPW